MQIRLPFVVALIVAVLGGLGWFVGPIALHHYRAVEQHRQDAADERSARKVGAVLARLALPPGVETCGTPAENQEILTDGMMCWRGTAATPLPTTIALRAELIAVGGTDVAAKCVDSPSLGDVCNVTAKLAGYDSALRVEPQLRRSNQAKYGFQMYGVQVEGGGGSLSPVLPNLTKLGKPIPLP